MTKQRVNDTWLKFEKYGLILRYIIRRQKKASNACSHRWLKHEINRAIPLKIITDRFKKIILYNHDRNYNQRFCPSWVQICTRDQKLPHNAGKTLILCSIIVNASNTPAQNLSKITTIIIKISKMWYISQIIFILNVNIKTSYPK